MNEPKKTPASVPPPTTDAEPQPDPLDKPPEQRAAPPGPASPTQPTTPPTRLQRESEPDSQPQAKVDLADHEPLSVVVLDTPAAEPAVEPETQIEVPVEVPTRPRPTIAEPTEAPRVPFFYWAMVAVTLGLVLLSYRTIFAPLIVRLEDGVERHVLGDKIYEAPKSNPHTIRQKESWFHF